MVYLRWDVTRVGSAGREHSGRWQSNTLPQQPPLEPYKLFLGTHTVLPLSEARSIGQFNAFSETELLRFASELLRC